MSTFVFLHAHPDDESIGAGGTIAKAAALGHRVIVIVATNGEEGTQEEGLLRPGEALADRRRAETVEAAGILGVARLEFLGYRDSGMMGAESNQNPDCFWAADLEGAAGRVAAILVDEQADVFAIYDKMGITGHPDHLQVNRVGGRAAARAGVSRVVEWTMSRSQAAALIRQAINMGATGSAIDIDFDQFGTPDELITDRVDVRAFLDVKRRAMAAHASQISETSFFLNMDPQTFGEVWGEECLIDCSEPRGDFARLLAERP